MKVKAASAICVFGMGPQTLFNMTNQASDTSRQFTALVYEPDALTRSHLKALLGYSGYAAEFALSGPVFKEMAERNAYEVCFIGLSLKGDDGLALIEDLRHLPTDTSTSLVVALVERMESALEEILKGAGADMVFEKPLRRKALRKISEALAKAI